MKAYNKWNYKPFIKDFTSPYICTLEPCDDGVTIEYRNDSNAKVTAYYKKREGAEQFKVELTDNPFTITGLSERTDYEINLADSDGHAGKSRFFRTGFYPGKVIDYLHPEDNQYLFAGHCIGSPNILRLPCGALLAAHDIFCGGTGGTQENFTIIFRSDDDGNTWHMIAELFSCFWPFMFLHNDKLYIMANSRVYGDLLIGRSDDDGVTWSTPTVLARSCCAIGANKGFHRNACQLLNSHGRLWFGVEHGSWACGIFHNTLLSVPEDADLLDADNWNFTSFACVKDAPGADPAIPGAIEGIPFESLDGKYVYLIARYGENRAAIFRVNADEPDGQLEFYRFIELPVSHSRFELFRMNGTVYALGNILPLRNAIALFKSDDLEHWEKVQDVLDFRGYSHAKVGIQYPSAFIEDDTLYMVSRTAFNGAVTFHDSNCMTFHKVKLNL